MKTVLFVYHLLNVYILQAYFGTINLILTRPETESSKKNYLSMILFSPVTEAFILFELIFCVHKVISIHLK